MFHREEALSGVVNNMPLEVLASSKDFTLELEHQKGTASSIDSVDQGIMQGDEPDTNMAFPQTLGGTKPCKP